MQGDGLGAHKYSRSGMWKGCFTGWDMMDAVAHSGRLLGGQSTDWFCAAFQAFLPGQAQRIQAVRRIVGRLMVG